VLLADGALEIRISNKQSPTGRRNKQKMNISPQSWRRVSELLETGMEMSASEREGWLNKLASTLQPDELTLLEPLKKLLAQSGRVETDDILRMPPDIAGALIAEANAPQSSSELCPGAEFGAYRLIRELGRGGMGSVWFAERIDGKLKRSVALKFPYTGAHQRQLVKRLQQERDILANLEHPNIARLYDADVANLDRPFLVLEYVDGIAIDEYCRAQRLPLKARLELFRQVFDAVQYAHTRLVIHRDLKPSNMLVTAEGVVRLLDFGIAKVLATGDESNASLTEIGHRVLTPNFASPEQIMGAELTTASDVFALGIVLYELLTGARPYRLKREGRGSLEDAIAAADIIAPSAAAAARHSESNARQIAKELHGDLDTILLKALKKRPDERYPTVAAFADDINRYLRNQPVLAQADSAWYRIRKFAGRNRLAVGATLSVVLSLGIGLSIALWQLHTARVAQKRAEDVKEFIASIFRSADPFFTGNESMSAGELLALAKQRIDRELQDQPENAIELLTVVGESQVNLEQYDAARATLAKAISLGEGSRPDDDLQMALARGRLAQTLVNDHDFAGAKPLLAKSIPVLRHGGAKAARGLSDALQFQAFLDQEEGKFDLAVAESHEGYQAVLAALGPKDTETVLAKRHWAQQLLIAGRFEEALPPAKQAFEESQTMFAPGERNALLPETEGLYGRLLTEMGKLEPGIEHLNKAIDISTAIYGPKSTQNAAMLRQLMVAKTRLGDFDGMIATARRSLDAALDQRAAARPLTNLGRAYLMARRLPQAEEILHKAIAAEKAYDYGKSSLLPVAQAEYATVLLHLGRGDEAESMLKNNSLIIGETISVNALPHWNAVALAKQMSGHWAESEQAYRQLLERTNDSVAQARWRADALNGMATAQLELGHTQEAETSLREADQAARLAYVQMTPPRADVLVSLARTLLQENRVADALPLIEEADLFWQHFDADNHWAGEAAYWHGQALIAIGKKQEARNSLTRAAELLRKSPIASDAKLANAAMIALRG
jgi:eukaryotic-like serine/threonine-protein kinase